MGKDHHDLLHFPSVIFVVTVHPNRNIARLLGVTPSLMAKPLIDYYKEVLSKISFADQAVFRKEMRKAFHRLIPEEREALKHWFRTSCVCKMEEQASPGEFPVRG